MPAESIQPSGAVCLLQPVHAARAEKAKKIFPRPTAGPLRPIVHGQTIKYNLKKRLGRGFTFEELKVTVFKLLYSDPAKPAI